ncbi:MAG: type II toxin-antitoxin system ParD family antitoxin [Acidobacteria bacterium]|nr:type II toxin-antitoxin system ParD family antitoxin [Acidobacteriota bacterium]
MNLSLTPEMEKLVRDKVASGMYHSVSEVVREALSLLKERDQLRERRLDQLRKEIARGVEQVEQGQVRPFDAEEIKAEGRRRSLRKGLIFHSSIS